MSVLRFVALMGLVLLTTGCSDSSLGTLSDGSMAPSDDDDVEGAADDDDLADDDDSGSPYDDTQPDGDDDDGSPDGPDDDDDESPDGQDDDDETPDGPDDDDDDATPIDADDECFDPDSAYDMHPAAGLVVTQALDVSVVFEGGDAGYTSELYLYSPDVVYLGTGNVTAPGLTTDLGVFTPGLELIFSIVVTNNGTSFYSGPASRNDDGFDHVAVTYVGECTWVIGFEDEFGGGDQDFNDIELTITGPLEMQLVM